MKTLFKGKFLEVLSKDNKEFLLMPESVVILANIDERIILIENYRTTTSSLLLELPAGWVEKGEKPVDAATRELEEETGYKASEMNFLLNFYLTPGYSTEKMSLFEAVNLTKVGEPKEVHSLVFIDREDLMQLITNGNIIDAKTILSLLFFLTR